MSDGEHQSLLVEIHNIALQLAVIKQKQEDNHADNKNDIRILYDKVSVIDKLPCAVHLEKFSHFEKHYKDGQVWRTSLVGLGIVVLTSIVSFGVSWGALQERVIGLETDCENNHKVSTLPATLRS